MDQIAEILARDTVRIERLIAAAPERVWAHLVDPQKRIRWLAGGTPIPETPGAGFDLAFNHARITDEAPPPAFSRFDGTGPDMVVSLQVLECQAQKRLKITWAGETPSEVLFELSPEGAGTRLVITHSRLAARGDMLSVSAGWNAHLNLLDDELAGQPHRGFWTDWAQYKSALDPIIPQA